MSDLVARVRHKLVLAVPEDRRAGEEERRRTCCKAVVSWLQHFPRGIIRKPELLALVERRCLAAASVVDDDGPGGRFGLGPGRHLKE